MHRLLPPLLLALLLAGIGVRVLARPSRDAAQERIRVLTGDRRHASATAEAVDAYLTRFEDPEDHWFAVEAYLRVGRYTRALEQVLGEGVLRDRPGSARRFGRLGLEILGWSDIERRTPTSGEPAALIALTEGRIDWAEARLATYASERGIDGITPYLFHAIRHGSAHPTRILLEGMAANAATAAGDRRKMDIAIAFTRLGPTKYEGREQDITLLLDVLPSLRSRDLHAWVAATSALGRSEDPRAVKVLKEIETRLAGTTEVRETRELALVRCALLASGDWEAHDALAPAVDAPGVSSFLVAWYLEALLHRFALQDPKARIPLGDVWLEQGIQDPKARRRIATALLFQDEPPPDDTPQQRGPIQKMVHDMIRMEDHPIGPVMGHTFMVRIGEPGAKDRLFTIMRQIAAAWEQDPRGRDDVMRPSWIMGLRGLLLYGDTPEQ